MPNYQYKCECGKDFVITCSMKEYKSVQLCPICGKLSNRKVDDLVCTSQWKCDGSYERKSI